ncbi:MAG: hypothetical protein AAF389_03600 [Gemmatimonadota bacterium]
MRVWVVAAMIALAVALVQTTRLRATAMEGLELSRELSEKRAFELAYEENVLRQVREDLAAGHVYGSGAAEQRVYMIVDVTCAACKAAIDTLGVYGTSREFIVASFVDDPQKVREWLAEIGADLPVLDLRADETALRQVPRRITPLYLEVESEDPVGVHAGMPKAYWLDP